MTTKPFSRADSLQIEAIREQYSRKVDALKMFRPLPHQEQFFLDNTSVEIGLVGGNRSGKTMAAAVRLAAYIRNMPIIFRDGREVHVRPERHQKQNLLVWVIGLQLNHIGDTLFPMLFENGQFRIIKDLETGEYRAFDPTNPSDLARKKQSKPAPPLIPPKLVRQWGWHEKRSKQFSHAFMQPDADGCECRIVTYASTADKPKQGDAVHYIWIDEEIATPTHYSEWQARLSDHRGILVWSSWPADDNPALVNLKERADRDAEKKNPKVRVYCLSTIDNTYISDEAKSERMDQWDEDTIRARIHGEFSTNKGRMYWQFSKKRQIAFGDDPEQDDQLAKALRERNGEPPEDWAVELVVDCGTRLPAALLCAVPPPEFGEYYVPYAEIYGDRMDAMQLLKAVKRRIGDRLLIRMIIDPRAARQTPMGFSMSVGEAYSRAAIQHNVWCMNSGHRFTPGSDDVSGRIAKLQELMNPNSLGLTPLRIVAEACPNLVNQLFKYRRKNKKDITLNVPADNQQNDVAQCLEYWVSRRPTYVTPMQRTPEELAESRRESLLKAFGFQPKPKDRGICIGLGSVSEN